MGGLPVDGTTIIADNQYPFVAFDARRGNPLRPFKVRCRPQAEPTRRNFLTSPPEPELERSLALLPLTATQDEKALKVRIIGKAADPPTVEIEQPVLGSQQWGRALCKSLRGLSNREQNSSA